MLPIWCMAFAAQHQEIDFLTLKAFALGNESDEDQFQAVLINSDSEHDYSPEDNRDKSPINKPESENSEDAEEKEEKNENKEDHDQGTHHYCRLISQSKAESALPDVCSFDSSIVTTPFYILFHSWKSDLV